MMTMLQAALESNDPLIVAGAFISVAFIIGLILSAVVFLVVRINE